MRKIKFRAWESYVEKMTEPFTLEEIASDMPRNMKNYAVMQYTGLSDKNGVEIYEGDIVRFIGVLKIDNFIVEWINKSCKFKFGEYLLPIDMQNCEVIGNIYQNPVK